MSIKYANPAYMQSFGLALIEEKHIVDSGIFAMPINSSLITVISSQTLFGELEHDFYIDVNLYNACIANNVKIDPYQTVLYFDSEEAAVIFKLSHM